MTTCLSCRRRCPPSRWRSRRPCPWSRCRRRSSCRRAKRSAGAQEKREPLVLGPARSWTGRPDGVLDEVLVRELGAVDGLAAGAVWLVKSPPWHMNWGITRWKEEPLKPKPFAAQHGKFSADVFGENTVTIETRRSEREERRRKTVRRGRRGVRGASSSTGIPSRETTARTTKRLAKRGAARTRRAPGEASRVVRGDALSSSARAFRCRQKAIAADGAFTSRQNI